MGIDEVNRIRKFFAELRLHPLYREHAPVVTSEEAALTRGDQLQEGIKALLFTNGDDQWVMVDLPADQKVDKKKVAEVMGWPKRKIRMATPEEVMQKTGCEIGAVPPFGHKQELPILVDQGIYKNQKSAFNIGLRTCSVKILTMEMKIVFEKVKATGGNFTRQN
jgi:prolyl-tRNA editing enzyme YbaK/EbsC (Cys-tRNA(Pro) deacylase)